jgi:hypothetical protein
MAKLFGKLLRRPSVNLGDGRARDATGLSSPLQQSASVDTRHVEMVRKVRTWTVKPICWPFIVGREPRHCGLQIDQTEAELSVLKEQNAALKSEVEKLKVKHTDDSKRYTLRFQILMDMLGLELLRNAKSETLSAHVK